MIYYNNIFSIIIVYNIIAGWGTTQKQENIRLPLHRFNKANQFEIQKFILKGYVVLDQADGDLNGDGLIDKVLILKLNNEATEEEKRPIILLIRGKNRKLIKAAENDNIVLSLGDGGVHGDPYHGITIKHGYFSIEHFGGSGWRWNQVITFKYNRTKKNWLLTGIGNESWHIDTPGDFSKNLQTNRDFGDIDFTAYKNKFRDNN